MPEPRATAGTENQTAGFFTYLVLAVGRAPYLRIDRPGVETSFGQYCKFGMPVTLLTLLFGM